MARQFFLVVSIATVMGMHAPAATSQDLGRAKQPHRVGGEKLDNGLGQMPHFRDWRGDWRTATLPAVRTHAIPGEKLDSGLGELPPHSEGAAVHTAVRQ